MKLTQYAQDGVWNGEDISLAVDRLASVRPFIVGASPPDGDLTTADPRAECAGPPTRASLHVGAVADPRRVADVAEVESPDNQRRRNASRLATDDNCIAVFRLQFTRGRHCDRWLR